MKIIEQLNNSFKSASNSNRAEIMCSYMKDHFPFYGIQTPERKSIVALTWRKYGKPRPEEWSRFAQSAFSECHPREMQYAVGDLLRPIASQIEPAFLDTIEELIQRLSWWDTVDWLAPKLAGNILRRHPDLRTDYSDKWIQSENIWLVRSAILHQLHNKKNTDSERLKDNCLRHRHTKEFFIQKAMGWAIREYSKVEPEWVRNLFKQHSFPRLTVREGSKYTYASTAQSTDRHNR